RVPAHPIWGKKVYPDDIEDTNLMLPELAGWFKIFAQFLMVSIRKWVLIRLTVGLCSEVQTQKAFLQRTERNQFG
ncbi:MAG: hypothetical protein RMJ19_12730, partial [Gemmatales bacterium]|nr:hypothetical protein [Gemmatales bacterium]MDW8176532.1 hypothetical protein [Gemmatales bacterium]